MKRSSRSGGKVAATVAAVIPALLAVRAVAKDAVPTVRLDTTDVAGKPVKVPTAGDEPSLLLFARPEQDQSRQAIETLKAALKDLPPVQVVVIVSGKESAHAALSKFAAGVPWPVVPDPDYETVGQLRVRVWPTIIVADGDGKQVARLTGQAKSSARDLGAYLAFATKKIDRKVLDEKLSTTEVVGDSDQQMAARHLRVGQRLLAKGMAEQAWREFEEGLKYQPKDLNLLLARARVLLLLGKPMDAMEALPPVDEKSSLSGKVGIVKGAALVELKRWGEAIPVLETAVKLNPDPAEGYYFLGVAYQRKSQWSKAAQAFRAAFEATPEGRPVAILQRPSGAGATTKPKPGSTKPSAPAPKP